MAVQIWRMSFLLEKQPKQRKPRYLFLLVAAETDKQAEQIARTDEYSSRWLTPNAKLVSVNPWGLVAFDKEGTSPY